MSADRSGVGSSGSGSPAGSGLEGQGGGSPAPSEPRTSRLALFSLILGICGIITWGLSAIPGLVLGLVSLRKIKASGGAMQGTGLAIAGIVTSAFMLVLLMVAVLAAMLMPGLAGARDQARKAACMNNLHQIGLGFMMYLNDHRGEFPDSFHNLEPYLGTKEVLVCPARKARGLPAHPEGDYRYVGRLLPRTDPLVIIVYDRLGNHRDGRNALFVDSHVEWIQERDFRARLGESLELVKRQWDGYPPDRRAAIEAFYRDEPAP